MYIRVKDYLDSGLGEVDPAGQVLPDEGVGVVRPLEHSLQSLQLAAVEGGPVPALLPLLLLLRVHLLVCRQKKKKEAMSQKLYGNTKHFSLQRQRRCSSSDSNQKVIKSQNL